MNNKVRLPTIGLARNNFQGISNNVGPANRDDELWVDLLLLTVPDEFPRRTIGTATGVSEV